MNHITRHTLAGQRYGYPICCVSHFVRTLANGGRPSATQILAGEKTGFLPCPEHSLKLITGRITLADLIAQPLAPSVQSKDHSQSSLAPSE